MVNSKEQVQRWTTKSEFSDFVSAAFGPLGETRLSSPSPFNESPFGNVGSLKGCQLEVYT